MDKVQNSTPDIEIEINGQQIKTQPGKMIIEVADENGIYIPRFCYHKKLSIAANCRMCLVEEEKAPKTLPACATPINPGMKIFTQSAKTMESQRAVMEFLLINHPLDCPICDQGGQCELQDFSLKYGKDSSDYREEKRAVANDDFGPLIATEMTRCIHCTRCVRFGKEVAGVREIGATGRGEHMQISTYVKHTIDHELSGNIIDLCPVGALLSKPFLYKARAWELKAIAGIAPHDGLGSNIMVHTRRNEVMRITPRDNEAMNENWLSDRDRFSYEGLTVDRLEKPMIKDKNSGEWREVNWQTALNYVADAVEKIHLAHGVDSIGVFLSPNSTLEEAYLLKRLCDHMESSQIEYRMRSASAHYIRPGLHTAVANIEHQKNILVVGSHLRNDQPLLAHRVRKAALKGAKVSVIDSVRHSYAFDLHSEIIVKPSMIVDALSNFIKLCCEDDWSLPSLIIMGEYALNHPDADMIHALLSEFSKKMHSTLGILSAGANALGCDQVGAWTPADKKKVSACHAYILHGIEPEFDVAYSGKIEKDLLSADLVVAVTPFISHHLKNIASVLLPSAAFTETSGTFVNLAGERQSFMGCVLPTGEARPAWKIYRVLGNLLGVPDFNFDSSEDLLRSISIRTSSTTSETIKQNKIADQMQGDEQYLERITHWPDCRSDGLVRRAKALNDRALNRQWEAVHLHPETAKLLNISDGQDILLNKKVASRVVFDINIAPGAALIAGGTLLAAKLGDSLSILIDLV